MKNFNGYSILLMALMMSAVAFVSGCGPEDDPVEDGQDVYKSVVIKDIRVSTSNLSNEDGVFSIYLPADWETSGEKYPVLYLLHGMFGDNNDWIKNGMREVTDRKIRDADYPRMIVVMPDGNDDFYVNGLRAGINYEKYFHEDLIPYIESHYPCLTDRRSRAIGGLSMGGFGSVYHAFTYPEKFCLAFSMSGAVEGTGDVRVPSLKTIFEQKGYDNPDTWSKLPELIMECGTNDYLVFEANEHTHSYLEGIGFPHTYNTRAGSHDWLFWMDSYPKLLSSLKPYFAK